MNPRADFFFINDSKWHKEYEQLRKLILECGLTEELKWGCPCYVFQQKNIVLIHGFKEYCAILFFKGAMLSDPEGILIQQTKNVQVPRQLRFTDVKEIVKLKRVIKAYVFEAIEVEKAGLKYQLKKTEDYPIPGEFQLKLDEDANLNTAFNTLTPGRQRAYLFHFSQAKQSKTREARIEKYLPRILAGKGIDD